MTANLVYILFVSITAISKAEEFYGDEFTQYYSYYDGWMGDVLICQDNRPCTVNCYGFTSCESVTIYGPHNDVLTVNCNGNYQGQDGSQGCVRPTIYAQNSTELHINAYNDDYQMYGATIYTPTPRISDEINTYILCGIIGPNSETGQTMGGCLESNNIFSKNGFSSISWTYYDVSDWSITPTDRFPDTMRCGDNFDILCSPFNISDSGCVQCADDTSQCTDTTPICNFTMTSTDDPTTTITNTAATNTATTAITNTATTATTAAYGSCDEDESLDRDDCDENENEPTNECSILIESSFSVCYIDCYEDKRSSLWNNLKQCLCKNIFDDTDFDDNKKKCYIEKYHFGNLVEVNSTFSNEYNCSLQQIFEFSTAIFNKFNEECGYLEEVFEWISEQYVNGILLDEFKDCNLLFSQYEDGNYPKGFVGITAGAINMEFRDENGDIVKIYNTGKATHFFSIQIQAFVVVIFLIILSLF